MRISEIRPIFLGRLHLDLDLEDFFEGGRDLADVR